MQHVNKVSHDTAPANINIHAAQFTDHVNKVENSSSSIIQNDLGYFIQATKSVAGILESVCAMSDGQRYSLLKMHGKPSTTHIFPARLPRQCNRAFKHDWLAFQPWSVKSSKLYNAFCVFCALFIPGDQRKQMGALVNTPIIEWHHESEVFWTHADKEYHKAVTVIESPLETLPAMMDTKRAENIKENRHILYAVANAVLF